MICPSCGGPPVTEDTYFDEQKLRMENLQLKEEVDINSCSYSFFFSVSLCLFHFP